MDIETKKNKTNTKNQALFTFAVAAAFFLLMLVLNTFTPYTSDDYSYHFVYENPLPTESSRLLSGIWDIPYSMANHYKLWGGRVVAHSIVQFFMLFDKWVFNIFNSLIFALCGILIYFHIERDYKKHNPLWLAAIYFAMWFFIPQFGISVLWVSGACNYIWMATLILLFLLPYRYSLHKKLTPVKSLLCTAGMIPFGFIAGCTNENAGGAAALTAAMLAALYFSSKKRIPLWSITGIIAAGAGLIFLVIAPGNTARGGKIKITGELLLSRLDTIGEYTMKLMWLPLLFLAVLIILFSVLKKRSFRNYMKEISVPTIYFICGAANIIVLAATSSIYRRSWLLSIIYLIIICGLFMKKLKLSKIGNYIKYAVMSLVTVSFIFSYAAAAKSIIKTYNEVQIELTQIQQQKAVGIEDVIVTRHERPSNEYNALYGTANLTNDRQQWFNLWIAKYYGVKSVGPLPPSQSE